MNKKVVKKIIGVTLAAACVTLALKELKKKNYLKMRNLINKDTKVLHVYTCDYIIQKMLILKEISSIWDKREGEESSVYTARSKDIVLDVYSENFEVKNTFEREYKQILKFATELNDTAPGAKMVIHVVSNIEADKFAALKEEGIVKKMGISIEIDNEFTEDIFEEE